jgi:phospholipase/carboxylesterase
VAHRSSRRRFLGALAVGGAALLAACAGQPAGPEDGEAPAEMVVEVGDLEMDDQAPGPSGVLSARPARPAGGPAAAGLQPLGLGAGRDGLVYVPAGYRPDRPAPLALLLHGAGGGARDGLDLLRARADLAGAILLAPDSRGPTWDLVLDWYGPDVAFLNGALTRVFERYAVDPRRVAIGGFSDGASYALSLGLTNGDLFGHVLAFSPGFVAPADQRGMPRIFVSHGTRDDVLPIDQGGRHIVPLARQAGYDVTYREFEGGHAVPDEVARAALAWFVGAAG